MSQVWPHGIPAPPVVSLVYLPGPQIPPLAGRAPRTTGRAPRTTGRAGRAATPGARRRPGWT